MTVANVRQDSRLGESEISNRRLAGSFAKRLSFFFIVGLLASCTSPVPTKLETAYYNKAGQDNQTFLGVWQTPQEELSSDSEIAILRRAYAEDVISETALHVSQTYDDDLKGALSYLKKQRFKCKGDLVVECSAVSKVRPLSKDLFASLKDVTSHCIVWSIEISTDKRNCSGCWSGSEEGLAVERL